jgi:hypothetical protein
MAAEAPSMVTNMGTRGIGYINADLTVGLARLPVGEWIGVQGDFTNDPFPSRIA